MRIQEEGRGPPRGSGRRKMREGGAWGLLGRRGGGEACGGALFKDWL